LHAQIYILELVDTHIRLSPCIWRLILSILLTRIFRGLTVGNITPLQPIEIETVRNGLLTFVNSCRIFCGKEQKAKRPAVCRAFVWSIVFMLSGGGMVSLLLL
jgi:hypothetical protein